MVIDHAFLHSIMLLLRDLERTPESEPIARAPGPPCARASPEAKMMVAAARYGRPVPPPTTVLHLLLLLLLLDLHPTGEEDSGAVAKVPMSLSSYFFFSNSGSYRRGWSWETGRPSGGDSGRAVRAVGALVVVVAAGPDRCGGVVAVLAGVGEDGGGGRGKREKEAATAELRQFALRWAVAGT